MAIIGALVALAIPFYQDYVSESKNSVMRANLHTLKRALMDYKADKGYYPTNLDALVPKYLMEKPIDPEPGAPADWGYTKVSDDDYDLATKYN